MFIRVYSVDTVSRADISDPALRTVASLTYSVVELSHPLPCVKVKYIQTHRLFVAWRGWAMLSPVGDHILQEFNTPYLTRFQNVQNC